MTDAPPGHNPPDPPRATGAELIRQAVKTLPGSPGVYRMLGAEGDVLYVGKARDLRKRVAAYTKGDGHTNRIARMIHETAELIVVTTASDVEALLLEANLIKRLKPRYNVILRDDKSFPHILLRTGHPFAQLQKHRGARQEKGMYFGPFASAGAVARTLNTLQRAFLLRSCSDSVFAARTRPCLLYQIKRCSAPCVGRIGEADYAALVDQAAAFLKGETASVRAHLQAEMTQAADELDFERAAAYRDRIRAVAHIDAAQGVNPETVDEADVVAIHADGGQSCVQVFFFRAGQNWGNRAYFPRHDRSVPTEEVLEAFLAQFYDERDPPRLILVNADLPGAGLLAEALATRAGRRVELVHPRRGEKRSLIDRAEANAREALARRLAESASQARLLEAAGDVFGLESPPRRIEVYDNSHIQGANPVGAMIVAGPDGFEKKAYRKFNMRGSAAGDDYAMLREMLTRRFTRLMAASETDESAEWPDLVLIDGGEGQLAVAAEVFAELGIDGIALAAISKGPDRDAGREHIHRLGRPPERLEARSAVLYFLQRLRDEAHRFAIGSHRARRSAAIGTSPLDEIPGIGAARKRGLLLHFGSAKGVANASLADLEAAPGISRAMARRIYDHFHAGQSGTG